MNRTGMVLMALFFLTSAASAADAPSVENGMKLFNSSSLGTNGRSCAACHPDGKGLEDASDSDHATMAKIANKCIVKALKGKALGDDSPEMTSLVMYMKTLGKTKSK